MKKTIVLGISMTLALVFGWQVAQGDDDDDWRFGQSWKRSAGVAPINNPDYVDECGDCHMAFPPGLLPARSWEKLMVGLDDHFGDNAELEPGTQTALTQYLLDNSADSSNYRRSRKVMRSLANSQPPLRITKVPYIQHEHDEIPARMVSDNTDVGSLSNCMACHQQADKGSFSERDINIPGYGSWDD